MSALWVCIGCSRCESSRGVSFTLWTFILSIRFSFTLFLRLLIGHSQRTDGNFEREPFAKNQFSRNNFSSSPRLVWTFIFMKREAKKRRNETKTDTMSKGNKYRNREISTAALKWKKFNIRSEESVEICNSKIDAFRYNLLLNARGAFYRAVLRETEKGNEKFNMFALLNLTQL